LRLARRGTWTNREAPGAVTDHLSLPYNCKGSIRPALPSSDGSGSRPAFCRHPPPHARGRRRNRCYASQSDSLFRGRVTPRNRVLG
jgi:hypothetical protein